MEQQATHIKRGRLHALYHTLVTSVIISFLYLCAQVYERHGRFCAQHFVSFCFRVYCSLIKFINSERNNSYYNITKSKLERSFGVLQVLQGWLLSVVWLVSGAAVDLVGHLSVRAPLCRHWLSRRRGWSVVRSGGGGAQCVICVLRNRWCFPVVRHVRDNGRRWWFQRVWLSILWENV